MNLSSVMDILDVAVDVDFDVDTVRLVLDSDLRRCNSMTVSILRIMER